MKKESGFFDFKALLAKVKADSPAFSPEPGTFTAREFAKAENISSQNAHRRLFAMAENGQIERTKTRRTDGWGNVHLLCGYRLPTKGGKKCQ